MIHIITIWHCKWMNNKNYWQSNFLNFKIGFGILFDLFMNKHFACIILMKLFRMQNNFITCFVRIHKKISGVSWHTTAARTQNLKNFLEYKSANRINDYNFYMSNWNINLYRHYLNHNSTNFVIFFYFFRSTLVNILGLNSKI
jgi:hypothetical protein